MFKPLRIFVEHQDSALVESLRSELNSARVALEAAERERDRASSRAIDEMNLNNELIDLCRQHGINYRKSLDFKTWMNPDGTLK